MTAPRVAVIGGGIAGSLCALVLRNRGVHPVIFDQGRNVLGGRLGGTVRYDGGPRPPPPAPAAAVAAAAASQHDCGAQFFRAAESSAFGGVLRLLEGHGLVAPWEGRFGAVGSRGGGFLPVEDIHRATLTNASSDRNPNDLGGLAPDAGEGEGEGEGGGGTGTGGASSSANPMGDDFCGFVAKSTDDAGVGSLDATTEAQTRKLYVGTPSNADLCDGICSLAQVEVRRGSRVTGVEPGVGVR
jgi:hypothetical protein